MSFVPTQMEPNTCRNHVSGLLMKTVANSTGRFSLKQDAEQRAERRDAAAAESEERTRSAGPSEKRADDARAVEAPATAVHDERGEGLQAPERLQRAWRSGVMRLSQRCMDRVNSHQRTLCRFQRRGRRRMRKQ